MSATGQEPLSSPPETQAVSDSHPNITKLLEMITNDKNKSDLIKEHFNEITKEDQNFIEGKAKELFTFDEQIDDLQYIKDSNIKDSLYKMQLNTIHIYMLQAMPKCKKEIKSIFDTLNTKINATNQILDRALEKDVREEPASAQGGEQEGGQLGGNSIKENNNKIKYILDHLVEAFKFYNTDIMLKLLILLPEKEKLKNLLSSLNVSEENKSITKFYKLFFIKLNKFPKLTELLKNIDKNVEYMIKYDTQNYIKSNNIPSQTICEIKHLSLLHNNMIINKDNGLPNLSKIYKCKKVLPHQNGDEKYILAYTFIDLMHQQSVNNLLLFLNNEIILSELFVLVNQLVYNILILKKIYYANVDLDKLNTL